MTLYSEKHLEFQKKVHGDCPSYGNASLIFAPMVSELINANKIQSLLDYGSGLGEVPQNLEVDHKVDVQLYDPAIEKYQEAPKEAEMVICLDVLDAVEPGCQDNVLDDLQRLTNKMAFISINTMLPDSLADQVEADSGRNFKPVEWWLPKLMERFELHYFSRISTGFVVVLKSLSSSPKQ